MVNRRETHRGRASTINPGSRFDRIQYDGSDEWVSEGAELGPSPNTEFLRDKSRTILNRNDSPDVRFTWGLNPYRGCEHGCVYCFARPFHEYLGYSAGLDFETKILVKEDAPELLRQKLSSKNWQPATIGLSGATDPYQPVERRLEITRDCLGVIAEFRNPVVIITKNHLVTRDMDHIVELNRFRAVTIYISVTTLDAELARTMEPRCSGPSRRLEAIARLSDAGVGVGVLVAPVIPALTDHEIPSIIESARKAGAQFAGYVTLRLPHGVKDIFFQWLNAHYPEREKKILNRMRSLHGDALYDSNFQKRQTGSGPFADQIETMFELACKREGLARSSGPLSATSFRRGGRRGGGTQTTLFDEI